MNEALAALADVQAAIDALEALLTSSNGTKLNRYSIWNDELRALGTYEAATEDAALDRMAQAYGFRDYDNLLRWNGISRAEAKSELDIRIIE